VADITLLLEALHRGEPDTDGALLDQVYAELRALARAKMAREQPGHTLQPTALVHEAWQRLGCGDAAGDQRIENRAHFFGAAAEAMRRILVERARSKGREKRGAGAEHLDVDEIEIAAPTGNADELLGVHEVLDRFAAEEPQKGGAGEAALLRGAPTQGGRGRARSARTDGQVALGVCAGVAV
jgi:RNA polymerase sigma factor (TIGR02999 family)